MPVTPPRDCLRTHDCGGLSGIEQPLDPASKVLSLHVIRIPAELRISPPRIRRVRTRLSPSAQFREVKVFHPFLLERNQEVLPRKMGVAARAGVSADVGEGSNGILAEQTQEYIQVPGRMADGVNPSFFVENKRTFQAVEGRLHGPLLR